jgi:hypothetical protein
MTAGSLTFDVRLGPAAKLLAAAAVVLDEALEVVPEWHAAERDRLARLMKQIEDEFSRMTLTDGP